MNIYLITRTDQVNYDEHIAHVIVAANAEQAREIAKDNVRGILEGICGENPIVWDNADIDVLGIALQSEPGIILSETLDG